MKPEVLWIIGSNASGKTTQSKLVHAQYSAFGPEIVRFEYETESGNSGVSYYTSYGISAHVGKVQDNQCTGTDSLSSKEQVEASYLACHHTNHKLILLDGILATGQWYDMIRLADVRLILIHLKFSSLEQNLERVKSRQAIKKGVKVSEVELRESTLSNVSNKMRIFDNLFNKFASKAEVAEVIDAGLEASEINKKIVRNLKIESL